MAKKRRITYGSSVSSDVLGRYMYPEPGAALFELVRDGCNACQTSETVWDPKRVRVDVFLHTFRNHSRWPYSRVLIVADHGHGFREDDLDRLFCIGRPKGQRTPRHFGSSEKGVGKLAANALKIEADPENPESFLIYTRTEEQTYALRICFPYEAQAGDVPSQDELLHADYLKEVDFGAATFAPYRTLKAFTVKVIPGTVFESPEQIRKALRPYLPRQADKRLDIRVQGEWLDPFPMGSHTISHQHVSACLEVLDMAKPEDLERAGIVLTDENTGFPCSRVNAPGLRGHFDVVLQRDELGGVISIPGLLEKQNTDRQGVKPEFLSSEFWRKTLNIIAARVTPMARELLGDAETNIKGDNPVAENFDDLITRFRKRWGTPKEDIFPPLPPPLPPRGGGGGSSGGGNNPSPPTPPPSPPTPPKPPTKKSRVALSSVFVDGVRYGIGMQPLREPSPLATVQRDRHGSVITLNTRYSALPTNKYALSDRLLRGVFEAIAVEEHPLAPQKVAARVDQLYCGFFKRPFEPPQKK